MSTRFLKNNASYFRSFKKSQLASYLTSARYLLLIILFIPLLATAQQKPITISGTVKDEKGDALEGVTVTVKGTKKAVLTLANGSFQISVPTKQSILVFTYIGFGTQERGIGNQNTLNIIMKPEAGLLNDVIVIGYGQVRRKDLTGSVVKANVEDMQKANVTSFDQALAGRVAGVTVSSNDGQPGAGSQITIRGSSVTQDATPLYVVDGFPIENMDLNSINPNDIESIEVLKDASSIAIYGARGANGVIIISTKRGKAGPTKITYNFSTGIQKDVKRMEMLSPYEFVKLQLELDSIRSTPLTQVTQLRNRYIDEAKGITLDSYRNVQGYDWQDMVLQTGTLQTHGININGGNNDIRFAIAGNYIDQKGIIVNTGMKRYDARIALDFKFNKNIKAGVNASYANTVTFGTIPTSGNGGGVVANMWSFRPVDVLGAQDLETSIIDSTTLSDAGTSSVFPDNLVNPLQQALNEYRKNITSTATINLFAEYTFLRNFKLRIAGGINSSNPRSEAFYNSKTSQGSLASNLVGTRLNLNGINGQINNQINTNYVSENTLTYRNKFGSDHVVDALVGFTYQYAKNNGTGFRSINIPEATEYLGILGINTGVATLPVTSGSHWQLYSLLSRINYTFKDRYLFTFSGRADGSSKFAVGKQWGYFPSGAFAWKFSKERFAENWSSVLTEGKLRVSYGSVGNNKVGDFSYLSQFGALQNQAGYPINNVYVPGIVPFFYGNNDLTWETSTELDLGTNLVFLDERISVDADYYVRTTKDFLIGVAVPFFAGYANGTNTQYQNTGRVRNSGFEFTLNTHNIKTKNFNWTSNFNISFNRSKILEFNNGFEVRQTPAQFPGIPTASQPTAWIAAVGYPIAQFYGYEWGGVYQYSDFDQLANGAWVLKPGVPGYATSNANVPIQPGDPKYVDLNGDGIVDVNDQKVIGTPLPVHVGGFNNNFEYKNWSLNIFFQWSYGNDVLNANKLVFESGSYYLNSNQFASFANRWTPNNPTNEIPRATYNLKTDVGGFTRISSRLIEDGSFMRLKTIALNYTVPAKVLRKIKLSSVRLYVSAQNIFTWTKYSGLDPEVSTYRQANPANAPAGSTGQQNTAGTGYTFIQPSSTYTALAPGYDYSPYPRTLTITFGARVTF